MLEIRTDVSSLTKDQREALAGFILTFDMPRQQELPLMVRASDVKDIDKITDGSLHPGRMVYDVAEQPEPTAAEVFTPAPPTNVVSIAGPSITIGAATLDKSGLPWDDRIHASTKALTADGMWRKKRGVTDALVAEVEGQLRLIHPMSVPPPPPPPPVPGVPVVPPPPGPNEELKAAFVTLAGENAKAMAAKKVTAEEVTAICVKHGAPNFPMLITPTHIEKVPAVAKELNTLIASRG
jgi:hypothetical protein